MALCKQTNCNLTGWSQLTNLCLEHYRELIFAKIWGDFIAAEETYFLARDSIYGVEVAMGLRPSLRDFYKLSYETGTQRRPPVGRRASASRTKQPSFETIADDGDLETDI